MIAKDKFISDRQRDRALMAAGYKVLRFSGSEIFNNPAGAPKDILEAISPLVEARRSSAKNQRSSAKGFGKGGNA